MTNRSEMKTMFLYLEQAVPNHRETRTPSPDDPVDVAAMAELGWQPIAPQRDGNGGEEALAEPWRSVPPVDLVLHCPACGKQHLDIGEFRTRVHRKHLCENTPDGPGTGCGHLWKPFEHATRGVLEVIRPEDS